MIARYIRPLLLLAALGIAAGASSANAQQAAPQQVSRAAFTANADTQFRAMDANKDGVLSRAEIEQFQRTLFLNTARAQNRAVFVKLDTNHDGQLSAAEFAQLVPANATVNPNAMLAQMDTNHDGQISRAEHSAASAAAFQKADTNHDGIVTQAELRAFAQSLPK